MAESSFPMREEPMSDEQWKQVTLGIGSGVLNEGGDPYRLTNISNASNQVTVAVSTDTGLAQAIVAGFYHRIDAPVALDVPAVTSTTEYWIVLEYSPLRLEHGDPPVQLKVVTALDTTSGRQYLVLHKILRNANQLLTDAAHLSVKPRIAPLLQVREASELPEAGSVLRGTVAVIHGSFPDIRIAKAETGQPLSWVSMLSGVWAPLSDHANAISHPVSPKQIQRSGATRKIRGQFYRSTGDTYGTSTAGYLVAQIDDEDLPSRGMRFPVVPVNNLTGGASDADAYVAVSSTNNELRLYLSRGRTGRIDLGQITYDVD